MNQTLIKLNQIGMIPVIKLEDTSKALPLAKALIDGGIPAAEVTFRAEGVDQVIAQIRKVYPEMAVGAGTVLSLEQAKRAIDAGALYLVSPGLNPEIVRYCSEQNIPMIPGCVTPTELEQAIALGLELVKFFPAEQNGGLAGIKALCGPYSSLKFIPTGGVNLKNISEYLSYPKIFACGGTFMAKSDLIDRSDWAGITALCRQAVETALDFQLDHLGINPEADDNSCQLARQFSTLFHKPFQEGRSSYLAAGLVEVMKEPYLGTKGHLALSTISIERAAAYLISNGVELDASTKKLDQQGNLKSIYLKNEIGGFAVHLVKR